jgi:hypothetical protein
MVPGPVAVEGKRVHNQDCIVPLRVESSQHW